MNYQSRYICTQRAGNNAFSWEKRQELYQKNPEIIIPKLIKGNFHDIRLGKDIVFEEEENGIIQSCTGLENFVQIINNQKQVITIFDNHNHALYFWLDAIRTGILEPGFDLIHIDEHSDLWQNQHVLDMSTGINNTTYAWEFTNFSCNVGNYIIPAINAGMIRDMIRIENEYQIDAYMEYSPRANTLLNIDIDIFAPELSHISASKKIRIIRNLIQQVPYVTIASSPFFIDQREAIIWIKKILENPNEAFPS